MSSYSVHLLGYVLSSENWHLFYHVAQARNGQSLHFCSVGWVNPNS
jgi:hypothetical protein